MGNTGLTKFTNLKCLVVEDYDFNREILVEMLHMLGVETDEAEDGEAAVEMAKKKNYDLIIMDIRMPKKDGYQATIEIRALPIKQPIILGLTASSLLQELGQCKVCGMEDYMTKPLEIEELDECLIKYFPKFIAQE